MFDENSPYVSFYGRPQRRRQRRRREPSAIDELFAAQDELIRALARDMRRYAQMTPEERYADTRRKWGGW